jgi:SAM-dependent methyltransferase
VTTPTHASSELFGTVADLYDEVRPPYPDALYDALEQAVGALDGMAVVDLAAGTGLQTRALVGRGARLVAVDPDCRMLRRLRSTQPDVPVIAARGEQIPLRDNVADLVVCATAWHWLHAAQCVEEIRRILRPGGHLALWWGLNRWGDNLAWEDAQSEVFERWESRPGSVPPVTPGIPPRQAADDLKARGLTLVHDQEFNWSRELTRDQHLQNLRTNSNNLVRTEAERQELLAEIAAALAPWPVVTERHWGPLVVARF